MKTENGQPIRVLVITGGGRQFCGIDSYLCSHLSRVDRERLQFDFLFCGENSFAYHEGALETGNSAFFALHLFATGKDASLKKWLRLMPALDRFLKAHPGYDAVHVNIGSEYISALCALVLRHRRIPVRLGHSHQTTMPKWSRNTLREKVKAGLSPLARRINRRCFTGYLACSVEAGVQMFGRRGVESGKFRILRNAIDPARFSFCPELRQTVRAREHIAEGTTVFCFVGRLVQQKNPLFALDILRCLVQKGRDAVLWVVGVGEDRAAAEQRAADYGLTERVRFWGDRSDVPELLQGADALLFPSLYEGLGIVAVEAQAAGLPVYASTEVPREAKATALMQFIPLSAGAEAWAEQIDRDMAALPPRGSTAAEIAAHGYDLAQAAGDLQTLYLESVERGKAWASQH